MLKGITHEIIIATLSLTLEILLSVEKVNPQPRFGEFGNNEPGSGFILVVK